MKGATREIEELKCNLNISIHAPVKGATGMFRSVVDDSNISIHAPVKGATYREYVNHAHPWNFNPRSREGSDATSRRPGMGEYAFQSTLP